MKNKTSGVFGDTTPCESGSGVCDEKKGEAKQNKFDSYKVIHKTKSKHIGDKNEDDEDLNESKESEREEPATAMIGVKNETFSDVEDKEHTGVLSKDGKKEAETFSFNATVNDSSDTDDAEPVSTDSKDSNNHEVSITSHHHHGHCKSPPCNPSPETSNAESAKTSKEKSDSGESMKSKGKVKMSEKEREAADMISEQEEKSEDMKVEKSNGEFKMNTNNERKNGKSDDNSDDWDDVLKKVNANLTEDWDSVLKLIKEKDWDDVLKTSLDTAEHTVNTYKMKSNNIKHDDNEISDDITLKSDHQNVTPMHGTETTNKPFTGIQESLHNTSGMKVHEPFNTKFYNSLDQNVRNYSGTTNVIDSLKPLKSKESINTNTPVNVQPPGSKKLSKSGAKAIEDVFKVLGSMRGKNKTSFASTPPSKLHQMCSSSTGTNSLDKTNDTLPQESLTIERRGKSPVKNICDIFFYKRPTAKASITAEGMGLDVCKPPAVCVHSNTETGVTWGKEKPTGVALDIGAYPHSAHLKRKNRNKNAGVETTKLVSQLKNPNIEIPLPAGGLHEPKSVGAGDLLKVGIKQIGGTFNKTDCHYDKHSHSNNTKICDRSLEHAQNMIDQSTDEDMSKVFKEMLCTFAMVCNKTQGHLANFKDHLMQKVAKKVIIDDEKRRRK